MNNEQLCQIDYQNLFLNKLGLFIGFITLLILFIEIWKKYLSPYWLVASYSYFGWKSKISTPLLSFYIQNKGAQPAHVKDIAVEISSHTKKYIFYPTYYFKENFLEGQLDNKEDIRLIKSQFSPFMIDGNQQVSLINLCFGIKDLDNPDLAPGDYDVRILLLPNKRIWRRDSQWKVLIKSKISLSSSDITKIASGTNIIQNSPETDKFRSKLRG